MHFKYIIEIRELITFNYYNGKENIKIHFLFRLINFKISH